MDYSWNFDRNADWCLLVDGKRFEIRWRTNQVINILIALLFSGNQQQHPILPVFPSIKHELIHRGILDPREFNQKFIHADYIGEDILCIASRLRESCQLPQLWELERFMAYEEVGKLIKFNRAHHHWLDSQRWFYPRDWNAYSEWMVDTDRRYAVYDALHDSAAEHYYVFTRRYAMKRLRDLLGPDDFYAGRLPSIVPLEYYVSID